VNHGFTALLENAQHLRKNEGFHLETNQ